MRDGERGEKVLPIVHAIGQAVPVALNRVGLDHIPCLCWTGLLLVELLLIGIPSSNILNSLSARDRIPFPNRPLVSSIEGRGTFGMWPKSPKQISWFH